MREAKHTPGPWEVEHPYGEPGTFIGSADTSLICRLYSVDHPSRGGTEECEYNARLIAAAPELLEAAHVALKCINAKGHRGEYPFLTELLELVISEATGQEPTAD
jgi:hypothetical protein